jgi:hypothetical protein
MSIYCSEKDRLESMQVFSGHIGDGLEDDWRARVFDHLREGHDGNRCPDPENRLREK